MKCKRNIHRGNVERQSGLDFVAQEGDAHVERDANLVENPRPEPVMTVGVGVLTFCWGDRC